MSGAEVIWDEGSEDAASTGRTFCLSRDIVNDLEEEWLSMVQAVCAGNFRASMIILIHTMRYFADIREIGIIITVWS
jgi:hypothetical protein